MAFSQVFAGEVFAEEVLEGDAPPDEWIFGPSMTSVFMIAPAAENLAEP